MTDPPEDISPRRLIAVFSSPLAEAVLRIGLDLGFHGVLVEPDPTRLLGPPRPHGDQYVADLAAANPDAHTDVLVTDHERPELGEVLAAALAAETRWIGVVGNPRYAGPHVAALRERGVPDDDIARVHRPVGLNIGSRTPAEIAVSALAGLLADRNRRPGGFAF